MNTGPAVSRTLLFALIALLAVVLAWPPLSQITSPVQGSYNEGWNAYRQYAAMTGVPLYAANPGYYVTNYTPLSFHIVGMVARTGVDTVLAGRAVSLAALLTVCAGCGWIVFLACRVVWAAVFAALLFWVSLAVFDPLQLGVDDPQFLGMAFLVVGYVMYLRQGGKIASVILPGVLFSMALMVKQSFIAVPLCMGLHLVLLRRWRDTALYAMTGLACCLVMTGFFYLVDGPHMLGNWFFERVTSWEAALGKTMPFLEYFQIPFIAAAVVIAWTWRRSFVVQSLGLALLGSLASGFAAVSGDGVNQNLYFDALFIVCALAASGVGLLAMRQWDGTAAPGGIRPVVLALLLLVPALVATPAALLEASKGRRETATVRADHAAARALIRSAPGPAICEQMKLCYDAGKPLTFDPFFVSDQLQVGRLHRDQLLDLVDGHCWGAIELEMWRNEPTVTGAARPRFDADFMTHLLANYTRAYASHDIANGVAVFLANPAAPSETCPQMISLPAPP